MSYIEEVDCDVCKHRGTKSCDECIHSYEDLEDLFEKLSREEISQRKELELKGFKESMKGEKLESVLDDKFKRSFALAHTFTSRAVNRPNFWGVYCGEDYLMASDTWALVKIKVVVPKSLVGKYILEYDEEGVFTAKDPSPVFTDGQAQQKLDDARANIVIFRTITKQSLDNFVIVEECEVNKSLMLAKLKDGPVLNSVFLERALSAIEEDEEFSISYETDAHKAVLIDAKDIECLILPVKVN